MNNEIDSCQKEFFESVDRIISKNMISHAYFLEHNDYKKYRDIVIEFCKRLLENSTSRQNLNLINSNFDYPEIKILEANGKTIKKEQVLELKRSCLEKPIMGGYIIYIIDGAEFLNASSANTLLKFLEEPEGNIIGILIANSRYQVINTLISRCQIISLNPNVKQETEYDTNVLNFIKKIKSKDDSLLIDVREFYTWEKQDIIHFLNKVQNCCLDNKDDILNMKIIEIIEEKKKQLKFNLNIKLFLDNLVIELIEVELCMN